ncbi:hypothetical protein [Paenarthrobacter aurescens]|uniref:hypothetical protein n=1 Tax=Paenarthrobacter aurescens TaxID=43663 RepID=UPI0021BF5C36|nr:hypothetical protein [Paenarthrobacter aurescens]MCT9867731.1 hypothetical protein [Paenarthrobacter aurescens]
MRPFPDCGDTALWLDGPIDYWKSADRAAKYTTEGHRLAQRVADEPGDGYEVGFRSYEEGFRTHLFRGTGSPNPRAVAAFDVLIAAARAEKDRIVRALTASPSGEGTGWFATSPISGSVFKAPREVQE